MSAHLTPAIGMRGAFSFREPFTGYTDVVLRVEGLRKVLSYAQDNVDIYALLYEVYKIGQHEYEEDLKDNVNVVYFSTSNNTTVMVPESFIVSSVRQDGFPYTEMSMVINFGALPPDVHLGSLTDVFKRSVLQYVGVEADIEYVATGWETLFTIGEHVLSEQQRSTVRGRLPECSTELLRERRVNEALRARLEALESMLLGNVAAVANEDICGDLEAIINGATTVNVFGTNYTVVSRPDQYTLQHYGIAYRKGFKRTGKWKRFMGRHGKKTR